MIFRPGVSPGVVQHPATPSRHRVGLPLCGLSAAVGYCTLQSGGFDRAGLDISLVILSVTAIVCGVGAAPASARGRIERIAVWGALLFPAYVALQMVPLPLAALLALSPARGESARALGAVGYIAELTPLTTSVASTFEYFSWIVGCATVFLLVRECARREPVGSWSTAIPLMLIGVWQTGWGLVQHLELAAEMSGSYVSRDHYAGLLAMVLPLVVTCGLVVVHRGRRQRLSAIWLAALGLITVSAGAMFIALSGSLSKGAFLASLGSLFVVCTLLAASQQSKARGWMFAVPIAFVALLLLVVSPSDEMVSRLGEVVFDPARSGRIPIAIDTVHMVADYPMFGTGAGAFYPAILRYQTALLNLGVLYAHNDYLQLMAELGIIGVVGPAAVLFAALTQAFRTSLSAACGDVRFLAVGSVGGISALLIHSTVEFNLYVPANAFILCWLAGLAFGAPAVGEIGVELASRAGRTPYRGALVGLGVVLALTAGTKVIGRYAAVFPSLRQLLCVGERCAPAALSTVSGLGTGLADDAVGGVLANVAASPVAPDRWCDLAEAMIQAGRLDAAQFCYARAVELAPNIPSILFSASNFYLTEGDRKTALGLMAHALGGNPDLAEAAFTLYAQQEIGVEEVLGLGVPNDDVARAYFRRLSVSGGRHAVSSAWALMQSKHWIDDGLAAEYVAVLMREGRNETAALTWAQYVGDRSVDYLRSNRIFNGDFELDLTGGLLDWKVGERAGARVQVESGVSYSGAKAVRIDFDGTENVSAIDLSQVVVVSPGNYRFRAFVKSSGLSTDEGVAFGLSAEGWSVRTGSVRGATGWTMVEQEIEIPPGVNVVQLALSRRPSMKFDNRVRGTVWIDRAQLVPQPKGGA